MLKLCPKLILEGTRLTHKTDLAFALNEHPRLVGPRAYRYHSPVVSAEWGAFDASPWGRGPITFEAHQEAQAMETFQTWARLFELQPYSSWIVDRFHLSAVAYQQTHHGRAYDFGWLEARLAALDFRLVVCTRAPETFEQARRARLLVSGNPSQYDDVGAFVAEQALLLDLSARSALTTLYLDMSDGDVGRAAGAVSDWLEATDGLYALTWAAGRQASSCPWPQG